MIKSPFTIAALTAASVSLALPAFGQTDDSKLGTVHFETSCTPEAQKLFDRGMLYQHSFWYRASQKTFEDVLKADPQCAIAYWGIALSLLWNPHTAPAAADVDRSGGAALRMRVVRPASASEMAVVRPATPAPITRASSCVTPPQ